MSDTAVATNPVFLTEMSGRYLGYIVRTFESTAGRTAILNTYSVNFDETLDASTSLHYILALAVEDTKLGPANYLFRDDFRAYLTSWGGSNHITDELFEVSFA